MEYIVLSIIFDIIITTANRFVHPGVPLTSSTHNTLSDFGYQTTMCAHSMTLGDILRFKWNICALKTSLIFETKVIFFFGTCFGILRDEESMA